MHSETELSFQLEKGVSVQPHLFHLNVRKYETRRNENAKTLAKRGKSVLLLAYNLQDLRVPPRYATFLVWLGKRKEKTMEEHTKTEQYLELDEEQLQAISGAVDDLKSFTADHLKQASDAIRMSDLAQANGLHPIGEGFAEEAAVHMDKVNTMIKDENTMREIERKSAWPTIQWK